MKVKLSQSAQIHLQTDEDMKVFKDLVSCAEKGLSQRKAALTGELFDAGSKAACKKVEMLISILKDEFFW
jgi:hypothetical protein